MRSIERYLLGWILGALCLGLTLVVLVSYQVTLNEMNEVFDGDLRSVALAVSAVRDRGNASALLDQAEPVNADDDDDGLLTQDWSLDGRLLFTSDPRARLPFTTNPGLSHVTVDDREWVVYTLPGEHGVSQAAQPAAERRGMARESTFNVLAPMLALVAGIGVVIVVVLRRGLRSLDTAARDVALRSEASLDPISTRTVPSEIVPLVTSVNGLMGRLATALSGQRRFLADAAHELRTPVTALRLQLQLLARSSDESARAAALSALSAGVERTQHLIEQLLQVARAGPDGEPMHREAVDLGEQVRAVVASMSVKADARQIDLGAVVNGSPVVEGDADQLTVLLNNLVENALRYTPERGVVDVEATVIDGRPALRVIDNGPGVSPSDRPRVFDRFFRGEQVEHLAGSGLGLAIVKAIADRHDATVSLHTPASGAGLEVRVLFAAAAS